MSGSCGGTAPRINQAERFERRLCSRDRPGARDARFSTRWVPRELIGFLQQTARRAWRLQIFRFGFSVGTDARKIVKEKA